MEQPPGPPAGWYPDPQATGTVQYWDGTAWTGQRAPAHQRLVRRAPGWWRALMLWGNVGWGALTVVSILLFVATDLDGIGQFAAFGPSLWILGNIGMGVLYLVVRRYETVP